MGSIDCVLIGNIEERLGSLTLLVTVVANVGREEEMGVSVLCAEFNARVVIVDIVWSNREEEVDNCVVIDLERTDSGHRIVEGPKVCQSDSVEVVFNSPLSFLGNLLWCRS